MGTEKQDFYINELADKWQAGSLTPEEKGYLENWYSQFNDEEIILVDSKYNSPDQIRLTIYNRIVSQTIAHKVYTLIRRAAAAAAVFLILGSAVLYRSKILDIINPIHQLQLTTGTGEHKQLILPDSSKIWLSPGTKINYPDKFRGNSRLVSIVGEAFFEVKHDKKHPFIVQSGKLKTVVLGTSFNVNAYKNQILIDVTVLSGKVAVAAVSKEGKPQQQVMIVNQRVVFNRSTSCLIKQEYPEAYKFLAQREGIFEYRGELMQKISSDIERQYGITIFVDAGLSRKSFYGSLKTTEPIDKTLDKLCTVMKANWKKEGGAYLLKLINAD